MSKEKPTTKLCKHCKTEIPYEAKICPNCRKKQGLNGCLTAIIIVVVIGLIGSCFGGNSESDENATSTNNTSIESSNDSNEQATSEEITEETAEETLAESKEEFISSCQEISYKDLLRNPENYVGQRIKIVAKIQQVLQGGWLDDNEYYRVQTDNDGYELYLDDEYFMYDYRVDDNTKLLQDDILEIYAEFAGLETVKRALTGTSEEIPAIKAYYVTLIGE